MNKVNITSNLAGFYKDSVAKRRERVSLLCEDLTANIFVTPHDENYMQLADVRSENVIDVRYEPLSVATNFVVNDQPVLVPMSIEEPSVVAGASKIAKLVSHTGGFKAVGSRSKMVGQIQLRCLKDIDKAQKTFAENKQTIFDEAQNLSLSLLKRGGGVLDVSFKKIPPSLFGSMAVIELLVDVCDSMGANVLNTLLEALGKKISGLFDGEVGVCILSNLCDQRLFSAECRIKFLDLSFSNYSGEKIAQRMVDAFHLASNDVYRAVTHNKGIMNGVIAFCLATGNDHRAIEAGVHCFASLSGKYKSLSNAYIDKQKEELVANITLPLAFSAVLPEKSFVKSVELSFKLLKKFGETSYGLGIVAASLGLAQNLAAVFALCSSGIQAGHMPLHDKKKQFLRNILDDDAS